jgi:hypothetical protein
VGFNVVGVDVLVVGPRDDVLLSNCERANSARLCFEARDGREVVAGPDAHAFAAGRVQPAIIVETHGPHPVTLVLHGRSDGQSGGI